MLTRPANDVAVSRIIAPAGGRLQSGIPVTPSCLVANLGTAAQTNVPVTLRIDSAGTRVFSENLVLGSIAPPDSAVVTCTGTWTPNAELWSGYTVEWFTSLPGDEAPGNDTLRCHIMVSTDTISSTYLTGTAPVIDGVLLPGEWDQAAFFDASNVAGVYGSSFPAGSVCCWLTHTPASLYFAARMPTIHRRDTLDQVGLFCDEDNDGQWPDDFSEGGYFAVVNEQGVSQLLYRYVRSGTMGPPSPVAGAQVAISVAGGDLVFEASIPVGTLPYKLNIDPTGDTIGLAFFGMLSDGTRPGWWRVEMSEDSLLAPSAYGKLAIAGPVPGVETPSVVRRPARFALAPNPVAGSHVHLQTTEREPRHFGLFDVTGKLLMEMNMPGPGPSLKLNISSLPAGTYIVRPMGSGAASRRAALVKL